MLLSSVLLKSTSIKVAVIILVGSVLAACQKNDTDDNSVLLQKLQGRWNFGTYVTNQYYSKSDHLNNVAVDAGDYMDFEQGGKLYLRLFSSMDTSRYSIVSKDRVVIDYSDTFDVRTITASELVLYNKKVFSSEAYNEQTFSLKK